MARERLKGPSAANQLLISDSDGAPTWTNGSGAFRTIFLNIIYPVGSIYLTVNSTNPGTLFGGTWVSWGSGRVPVGVNSSVTDFNTVEKTGGSSTHTLTTNQMPAHTHTKPIGTGVYEAFGPLRTGSTSFNNFSHNDSLRTGSTGGGAAHNNLQPYITCYMWKRTA